MYFPRFHNSLILVLILTFLMGCSGSSTNPVLPGQDVPKSAQEGGTSISETQGNIPLSERVITDPYGGEYSNAEGVFISIGTLGEFELHIDQNNVDAELFSIRKSSKIGDSFTVSGASYFTVQPCTDCLRIESIELTVDNQILVIFSVSHPFEKGTLGLPPSGKNRLDLDLFDLSIVVVPMSAGFKAYPLMSRSVHHEICTGMDGFTYELTNLTRSPILCPYYLVIDNNKSGAEENNRFPMGIKDQMVNTYFKGGGVFRIYLTMGYGASAVLFTRLNPTYYVPEFNKKAAWKVVAIPPNGTNPPAIGNTWDDSNNTTQYKVVVKVHDWQQGATVADPYPDPENTNYVYKASNVKSVSVEIPGMTTALKTVTSPLTGTGTAIDPLIYEVPIANEKLLTAGTYIGLVKVLDEREPPVGGSEGQPDRLVDSPDGVTLRWYDLPEFATYQIFNATVVPGKRITVTKPNGGETWTIGSSQTVTWTWGGTIPNVNVELSLNGGSTYTITLGNNIANTGSLTVNPVGNWPTTQGRVRVYDPTDLAITDQSNANFTIEREIGPIEVTVPNGGEVWSVGTSKEITWNAEATINFVRISLSLDSGVTYPMVLTGSTQNDGGWTWSNIPAEASSNQCKVKINNILDTGVFDESDANFTINCPLPNPPATVTASNGAFPDKIQITWSAVSGVTSYSVYRDSVLRQANITSTGWNDTTVTPGVNYDYQVSSTNICGEGALSVVDVGWACILPSTPTGVFASDGLFPDKVEVRWNIVPEATGYNIYRNNVLVQANWTGGPSWDDTTAVPGTHYNYAVSSVNSCGESAKSTEDEGWKCELPEKPTGLDASDGDFFDRVELTWNAAARTDTYSVYRDSILQQAGLIVTSWTDNTAVPGTHYQYTVRGINTCGDGPLSDQNEGWACVLPGIPSDVSATDGNFPDRVTVTWTAAGGATGYCIYRDSVEQAHNWVGLSWNDTTATQGVVYSYTVAGLNSCGESAQSAADTGWACVTVPVPTGVTADDGLWPDKVTVTWNPSAGATGYNIYRDNVLQQGNWALTTWDDLTMVPGTHYDYTVTSLNACGESVKSTPDEGWACTLPGIPTNVQASDGTFLTLVEITWNAVADATQYDIFRDSVEIASDIVGTMYQDNTVSGGVIYSFQVRAENACGTSNLSSGNDGFAQGCAADTNDTFGTADVINLIDTQSGCVDMVDIDWYEFYVTPNGIANGTIDLVVSGGTAEMRLYGMDPGEIAPGTLITTSNNIVINNNTYSRYFIRLIGTSGQVGYDLTTNITAAITNINCEIMVADDGTGVWPVWEAPDPDEELTLATLNQMWTWLNLFWNQYGYNHVWDGTPTVMASQFYILDSSAEATLMHNTYGVGSNLLCLYFVDQLNSGNTAYCRVYTPKPNHNVNTVFSVYSPNVWYWSNVIAHEHGHGIGYYFDEYLYDAAACACGDNICLGYTPYLFWESVGCYNGNLMWYYIGGWTWNMFDITVGQEQYIHRFRFEYPGNFPFY